MRAGMAITRHIDPWRWVFFGLLAAGVLAVCYAIAARNVARAQAHSEAPTGIYSADCTPELMPQTLLPGLILLTPEQLARVPEIDGFESPCGSRTGAMAYDAQPFGSPNEERGGQHLASDLNGIGGENSDLGEPVYAAARGLVVYSGKPAEAWGHVVILAHRLPGTERIVQTLYAHLDRRLARTGELVGRGSQIGTIGTADGHYLAHLHYEAIESRCTEAGMPAYNRHGNMNRLNPDQLQAQYPAPPCPDAYENLRRRQLSAGSMQRNNSESPSLPQGSIPLHPSQFLSN